MHHVMCAPRLELLRRHTHKNLANKLIVVLLQEVRSRDVSWPERSNTSPLARSLRWKCVPYSWSFCAAPFLLRLIPGLPFSWARDRLPGLHFRQHLEAQERRLRPSLPPDDVVAFSSPVGLPIQLLGRCPRRPDWSWCEISLRTLRSLRRCPQLVERFCFPARHPFVTVRSHLPDHMSDPFEGGHGGLSYSREVAIRKTTRFSRPTEPVFLHSATHRSGLG